MKKSSHRKPVNPATARNCFFLNQFATPGLGSLVGRRIVAGIGQLALALLGFALLLVWFGLTMKDYYGLLTSETQPKSHAWFGLSGVFLFVVSWCWALVTSTSIMNEAKNEPPKLA